jgi:hypothetical protein
MYFEKYAKFPMLFLRLSGILQAASDAVNAFLLE